jgi:hypothetical protein
MMMTDAHLMDAPCVHGVVWFECEECDQGPDGFTEIQPAPWEVDFIISTQANAKTLIHPPGYLEELRGEWPE